MNDTKKPTFKPRRNPWGHWDVLDISGPVSKIMFPGCDFATEELARKAIAILQEQPPQETP